MLHLAEAQYRTYILRELQATFEPAKSPNARLLLEIAPRIAYAAQVMLKRLTELSITCLSLHPGHVSPTPGHAWCGPGEGLSVKQIANSKKQLHEELRFRLIMR